MLVCVSSPLNVARPIGISVIRGVHDHTHLILGLRFVREPTVWEFIASKYSCTHDIGRASDPRGFKTARGHFLQRDDCLDCFKLKLDGSSRILVQKSACCREKNLILLAPFSKVLICRAPHFDFDPVCSCLPALIRTAPRLKVRSPPAFIVILSAPRPLFSVSNAYLQVTTVCEKAFQSVCFFL